MLVRRAVLLLATAGLLTVVAPVGQALASDEEGGYRSCQGAMVVWITERTSPGVTTIRWAGHAERIVKQAWSTTQINTGVHATSWLVTTTGSMDHQVTGASCRWASLGTGSRAAVAGATTGDSDSAPREVGQNSSHRAADGCSYEA